MYREEMIISIRGSYETTAEMEENDKPVGQEGLLYPEHNSLS